MNQDTGACCAGISYSAASKACAGGSRRELGGLPIDGQSYSYLFLPCRLTPGKKSSSSSANHSHHGRDHRSRFCRGHPMRAAGANITYRRPTSRYVCLRSQLLPYSDVRVTFQAGRRLAIDAAHKVETLNVTNASELIVGPRDKPLSQRRFPNVKEINCMSFVYDEGNDEHWAHSLCPRTLLRIVPFLV